MKRVFALLMALAMVLVAAGCGAQAAPSAVASATAESSSTSTNSDLESTAAGEMTIRLGAEYDYKSAFEATSLVSDTLVGLDDSSNATPGLLESWEINEDATEYILHLREGVTFSDGTPFTAEVCKYDIEALGAVYYCEYLSLLDTIEVVDDYTLKVTFKQSNISFLQNLIYIVALPIGSVDENNTITNFVGTGPFILQDYEANVEATLVRNDDYWDKSRLPAITEVKWVVIPDADARVMALESGQVDGIGLTEHGMTVPHSSLDSLQASGKYELVSQDPASYNSVISVGMNWTRAPLNDVNLRRALEYAIDRQDLVDTIYHGWVEPCGQMTNPAFSDGYAGGEAFTYDLDKARSILEESGYVLENGVLTKDGEPIVLEYLSSTVLEDSDLAVYVQGAFKELGITVNITALEYAQVAGPMHSGDYDLTKGFYWYTPIVGPLGLYGLEDDFNSMGGVYGGLGYGVTPEITEYGQEMLAATNVEDFKAASDKFWAANYEACPTIPVFAGIRTAVYSAEWTGFTYSNNVLVIDLSGMRKR